MSSNMKEVEMTDDIPTSAADLKGDKENAVRETAALTLADIKKNCQLIERGVDAKENRYITRVLRQTTTLRKRVNSKLLAAAISQTLPDGNKKALLLKLLKEQDVGSTVTVTNNEMDIDSTANATAATAATITSVTLEVEAYLHLLVLIHLIDTKHNVEATICSTALVESIQNNNRITLYPLSSKVFFYYSLSYQLVNNIEQIRPFLLNALRTATLRHNEEGQATLLNLLLRNYLEYNLIDQAHKLVSNTVFPEQASSNQYARYLYYLGRIKAIQLEYGEAYNFLNQAIRKAPQNSAIGFKRSVNKLLCIVQLLMGEIPERNIFSQKILKGAMKPYYHLTQSVRVGDLDSFHAVIEQYSSLFKSDHTFTLIQRLRTNVIKAGLKKICSAYSRISFQDICKKLKFDGTPEDMMFIVAKSIKDGVIEASVNQAEGYLQSNENIDAYSTQEPMAAFSQRIDVCLKIHNDALKAMRFHPDLSRAETEKIAEVAKTIKQELERQAEESSENGDESDF
ncbi:26S proteasome regulatory subunit S3 [Heterostelium album PN500]|uniref:26S proteasome regulatory subunit S3 n=1 Tax=Heterostelium pallidum (strain ATCC 26659 / Pp 5 / PN500) TaxID=670386 RepID=D3BBL0_HETP5|nr:26S proteasome regulatory subunit S3 [Heterostelium album PN500]EFA81043.1 26S proteasome regulatory subunit S3 [Heterostelium album PN500]|eukprot:XP_020433161.1 26S proteasome regulatory subunit S3 [Heterostelium album PN500]